MASEFNRAVHAPMATLPHEVTVIEDDQDEVRDPMDQDEGEEMQHQQSFGKRPTSRTHPRQDRPDEDLVESDEVEEIENPQSFGMAPIIVDLTSDLDDLSDDVIERLQREVAPAHIRRLSRISPRNLPLEHPREQIVEWQMDTSHSIRAGKTVELKEGGFLLVSMVIRDSSNGHIYLRGLELQRTRTMNGLFPAKLNEVCMYLQVDMDDARPDVQQNIVEVSWKDVRRERKLNITNKNFPLSTYRTDTATTYQNQEKAENRAVLALRWVYIVEYPTAIDRVNNKYGNPGERRMLHLREEHLEILSDQPSDNAGNDSRRGLAWRGMTVRGGEYRPSKGPVDSDAPPAVEDLTISAPKRIPHRPWVLDPSDLRLASPLPTSRAAIFRTAGQKYTFGDAFCGAGGATSGAKSAGFKVVWGLDCNSNSCKSWRANFQNSKMYEMTAHKLISENTEELRVDILHLSPPCQLWSPAHTVRGKNDEDNRAALFACGDLLDKARPRLVTLEQTFGLAFPRFRLYLNALLRMFIERGFSYRLRTAYLQDWGLPQRRFRLIIIASGPGEILPTFPPYTHSDGGVDGLKPYKSVNSTIRGLPSPNDQNRLDKANYKSNVSYDGTSFAPSCITTHGGFNYHPSGVRDFTPRELAALQGFPRDHIFDGNELKTQIGNAWPPSVVKVLYKWLREALEEADGIKSETETIIID